ncbi:DUF6602 domain-containing protein [Methanobacterium oryzae]|uniref:DUF6602 domain-containing protein n=1 Tax=Methanobacterium oryzae TaxID=69540 RepID=UPI003D1A527E
MDIVGIFDEVSKTMRSDFEKARKAIEKHPGLKGSSFEETFKEFLREYLPESLDISTGLLVDSNGNFSKQLDVIISDKAKTPIFFRSGNIRVIPIECAYAIIEIKASLNSKELDKAFENMKSVKNLEKKAYYKPKGAIIYSDNLYGKEWEIWPVNYYIFAYDSTNLIELAKRMHEKNIKDNLSEYLKIDTICVLDKGVICNKRDDNKIDALPQPGSNIYVSKTVRSLLLFYTLISVYLNQARIPYFKFSDYLGEIKF